MNGDFFSDNPMLGSVFDFDHDGSMDFTEATTMAGVLGAYANEALRDAEEHDGDDAPFSNSEPHERHHSSDDYVSDDEFDPVFEDLNGVSEVDASDPFEVMEAVRGPLYDWNDIEWLIEKALGLGTKFDEDEVEEICERIYDHELKNRLRCSI